MIAMAAAPSQPRNDSSCRLRLTPLRHHSQKCSQLLNDVISILAEATARATNHIFPVEARIRVCAYGDGPAASEFRQRHLFYGSAVEPSDDTRVMDDPPVTHIEAVMDVAAARRDKM